MGEERLNAGRAPGAGDADDADPAAGSIGADDGAAGRRAAAGPAEPGRDRDPAGRPRQSRPRDALGRPLPYGDSRGVEPVPEVPLPPAEALALAQSLLDGGRAFAAHEVLEATWKAAPTEERDLWQGLAQVCVGLTHYQRGNPTGAARLVRRGAARLRPYAADPPHGIDVTGVLAWCERAETHPADVPRLRAD
jgi:uncharacterized protein